jgi:hypothetical protein
MLHAWKPKITLRAEDEPRRRKIFTRNRSYGRVREKKWKPRDPAH